MAATSRVHLPKHFIDTKILFKLPFPLWVFIKLQAEMCWTLVMCSWSRQSVILAEPKLLPSVSFLRSFFVFHLPLGGSPCLSKLTVPSLQTAPANPGLLLRQPKNGCEWKKNWKTATTLNGVCYSWIWALLQNTEKREQLQTLCWQNKQEPR